MCLERKFFILKTQKYPKAPKKFNLFKSKKIFQHENQHGQFLIYKTAENNAIYCNTIKFFTLWKYFFASEKLLFLKIKPFL